MIIYPCKRLCDCIKYGAVPGTLFGCSNNGWIHQSLYLEWFKFFLRNIPPARPVLIIEDGHSLHISMDVIKLAQENNMTLLCLPTHMAHILQPLRCRSI